MDLDYTYARLEIEGLRYKREELQYELKNEQEVLDKYISATGMNPELRDVLIRVQKHNIKIGTEKIHRLDLNKKQLLEKIKS